MPPVRPSQTPKLEALQATWTTLYHTTLPSLAKARDPAQPKWPVTLDHCFARIILDNTVGKSGGPEGEDLQWDKVIGKPAVRNMSEAQLEKAIELGGRIERGEVNLVGLDEWSLGVRGKTKGGVKRKNVAGAEAGIGKEEKKNEGEDENGAKRRKVQTGNENPKKEAIQTSSSKKDTRKKQTQSTLSFQSPPSSKDSSSQPTSKTHHQNQTITTDPKLPPTTILKTLHKIQTHPNLTPFRKRLYTSLLSVPTGHHTTYAALATHLSSVPRAVGNGMRNNPFAPTVPCHRVLASDGTLGGFFGDWGVDGKHGGEKIKLLDGEGVGFDSGGKVKGMVWRGFWDLEDFEREFGTVE